MMGLSDREVGIIGGWVGNLRRKKGMKVRWS